MCIASFIVIRLGLITNINFLIVNFSRGENGDSAHLILQNHIFLSPTHIQSVIFFQIFTLKFKLVKETLNLRAHVVPYL